MDFNCCCFKSRESQEDDDLKLDELDGERVDTGKPLNIAVNLLKL